MTYADTVLWNWALKDPSKPISANNVRICDLFTRDLQEEHFFLTSLRIEIRGLEAMDVMARCSQLIERGVTCEEDRAEVAALLVRLAQVIEEITAILDAVRDGCEPMFFYFTFRPVSTVGTTISSWVTDWMLHSGFAERTRARTRLCGSTRALMARASLCNALGLRQASRH